MSSVSIKDSQHTESVAVLLTVVVKIDCAGSEKTSSDVKHLLSDCFAVDSFYNSRHTSTRPFTIWKVLPSRHLFCHIWKLLYPSSFQNLFYTRKLEQRERRNKFVLKSEACHIFPNPQIQRCNANMNFCPAWKCSHLWMIDFKSQFSTTFCLSYAFSIYFNMSKWLTDVCTLWVKVFNPNQQKFLVASADSAVQSLQCHWFTSTMFFLLIFFFFPQSYLSLQLLGKFL